MKFSVAWLGAILISQIVWLVYATNKWIIEPISFGTLFFYILNVLVVAVIGMCFMKELKAWWNK